MSAVCWRMCAAWLRLKRDPSKRVETQDRPILTGAQSELLLARSLCAQTAHSIRHFECKVNESFPRTGHSLHQHRDRASTKRDFPLRMRFPPFRCNNLHMTLSLPQHHSVLSYLDHHKKAIDHARDKKSTRHFSDGFQRDEKLLRSVAQGRLHFASH